ncbi:hypothetical protein [Archangium sp.]|nr:hypothetical protein [Archangium sp.]HYO52608.1 hypothetical protein [Archangium sp.]
MKGTQEGGLEQVDVPRGERPGPVVIPGEHPEGERLHVDLR